MSTISVITINYNNLKGLKKTMQSVFNQSFKSFEYIVIDGESNDGSASYINENSATINYWISEKDFGIYNAMNKGIKVATCNYILFLNSGDSFADEDVLTKISPNLNDEKSFVYGNMFLSKKDNRTEKLVPPSTLDFSYFVNNSLPHPATFIKRQMFLNYFFYNENQKIVSDWEFFIFAICKQNESYQYVDLNISDFDNDGISSQKDSKQKIITEENSVFEKHFPMFLNEVDCIRNIKSKRMNQLLYLSEKKIRWKILKGIINLFLGSKKVSFTKPMFNKLK